MSKEWKDREWGCILQAEQEWDQVWWKWAPSQIGPSLDHLEQIGVADFYGASHVPGHMNHGHNGFDVLHLVPLISFQGELVLIGCGPEAVTTGFSNISQLLELQPLPLQLAPPLPLQEAPTPSSLSVSAPHPLTSEGPYVPGDVVAPAGGLHPVHGPRINPHEVSRALHEAVHRDIGSIEIIQDWPPGTCQVVHTVPVGWPQGQMETWGPRDGTWGVGLVCILGGAPVAESADGLPVVFMHCEPLTVARAYVDVDRAEVVVLLVACRGQ